VVRQRFLVSPFVGSSPTTPAIKVENMPRISYIITIYNKSQFIPHLIHGLKSQIGTFEKEFIFVDDGSTDNSLDLLHQLTKKWANTTIMTQENQGPAIALNAGLERATGDYIKMMDGDDLLAPHATLALLNALIKHKADFIYTTHETQDQYDIDAAPAQEPVDDTINELTIEIMDHQKLLKSAFTRAQSVPTSWFGTAELFKKTKGSDPLVFVQDYSLELRLFYYSQKTLRTKAKLFSTPNTPLGRLSQDEAQTLHDVNLALIRFISNNAAIPTSLQQYGIMRVLSRARNWGKRYGSFSEKCKLTLTYLKCKAGYFPSLEMLPVIGCRIFHHSHPIRTLTSLGNPYSPS
jgi:glycosyltransferase involved in cell wall biosynthesis